MRKTLGVKRVAGLKSSDVVCLQEADDADDEYSYVT